MICPRCKKEVPGAAMFCIPCALAASYRGMLEQQLNWIDQVADGAITLVSRRNAQGFHVLMAGENKQAYCGMVLTSGRDVRTTYQALNLGTCKECREAIDALIERSRPKVA
jgi:hypothetical protein